MKIGILLVLALVFTDLDKIGKINTVKSAAKKAFLSGDFETAAKKYKYLVDSLGITEDEVRANLAAAYYQLKDTANALNTYSQIAQSPNSRIRSVANQQLGVIADMQGKPEEALNYFRQALKAAPENAEARYNYEVVKKKLEEKKKQQQQKQDQKQDKKEDQKNDPTKNQKDQQQKEQEKKEQEKKDQEQKNQQNKDQQKKESDKKEQQEQKDKQQKEKDQQQKEQEKKAQDPKEQQEQKDKQNKDNKELPPSVKEKLKNMQMPEEKAKMILEAMRNQEIQYLQQNRRKASKPKEKGKPDW
jgi:tetratricopeptide (TPR) repeat protein